MFKSQMRFQKILCLACLILSALLFVYAIGFVTPIYDQYFLTMDRELGEDYARVEGAQIFWELETLTSYEVRDVFDSNNNWVGTENVKVREIGLIDQMLGVAIADICVAILLFVFNTHKRRKYYIGNYIATGVYAAYNVAIAAWIIARLNYFIKGFAKVNLEQLKAFCEEQNIAYRPQATTNILYVGIALCVVLMLAAVAVVLNLLWKLQLQKRENKLLQQNQAEEVAVNG